MEIQTAMEIGESISIANVSRDQYIKPRADYIPIRLRQRLGGLKIQSPPINPGVWSDERVELLTEFWAGGFSASQIATKLGEVTRNAVIGKVHRLGLPGRATTSRTKETKPRQEKPRAPRAGLTASQMAHQNALRHCHIGPETGKADTGRGTETPALGPEPLRRIDVYSVDELTSTTCRWPIGDPQDAAGFHYCGRKKSGCSSYCDHHNAMAHRLPRKRKPGEKVLPFRLHSRRK